MATRRILHKIAGFEIDTCCLYLPSLFSVISVTFSVLLQVHSRRFLDFTCLARTHPPGNSQFNCGFCICSFIHCEASDHCFASLQLVVARRNNTYNIWHIPCSCKPEPCSFEVSCNIACFPYFLLF